MPSSRSATAPPARSRAASGRCRRAPRPRISRPTLLARSLARRLEGKPPLPFVYKDYGSLISLSSSTIGNLMGNLFKSVTIEGRLARLAYLSLYKKHQIALHGLGAVTLDRARQPAAPALAAAAQAALRSMPSASGSVNRLGRNPA